MSTVVSRGGRMIFLREGGNEVWGSTPTEHCDLVCIMQKNDMERHIVLALGGRSCPCLF